MSLKFTEELCVMTMKNDTKIEEELTCRFKIDMRYFTNFDPSIWKSKKFEFWLASCDQSMYCLSYKSTGDMTLKSYTHFEEKLTYGLKKDNLANFHQSTWKRQNWDFDGILKGMTLKFAEELCVMAMKDNAKFKEELTCHFKTDLRNLPNFDSSTRKFKKVAL